MQAGGAVHRGFLRTGTFMRQVGKAAAANGMMVHIASGAVGGFDVLRTIA